MPSTNCRSLPYHVDSELYMRALSEFPMPAFLDSGNQGGGNGRRDILAAAPTAYLKVEDGVNLASANVIELIDESNAAADFFINIRKLKEKFLPRVDVVPAIESLQDHAGSVIGNIGYPTLTGKADLVIHDAFVGFYLWTVVIDHEARSCELRAHPSCCDAFIDDTLARIQESLARVATTELAAFSLDGPLRAGSDFADYEQAFKEIKLRIDNGDCYQVNLTQSFSAKGHGDPLTAYLRLRRATRAPFSAFIHWGSGALLSLSPERFLRVRKGAVLTQPIKGTRPRAESMGEDRRLAQELAASEKDRAENLMIVDLMRNDLGRVCETGSIQVNQLFTVESFSNVHHMVSDVVGRLLPGKDALDVLASCYPGGSITGAPKLSAMAIIREVERDARRVYCGTVFALGTTGDLDSSITIRSLLWQSGVLHCWAGGGIVADSDCAQEYQECFDKINNIFSALQSFS